MEEVVIRYAPMKVEKDGKRHFVVTKGQVVDADEKKYFLSFLFQIRFDGEFPKIKFVYENRRQETEFISKAFREIKTVVEKLNAEIPEEERFPEEIIQKIEKFEKDLGRRSPLAITS